MDYLCFIIINIIKCIYILQDQENALFCMCTVSQVIIIIIIK